MVTIEYSKEKIYEILEQVKDPEIPVLSVIDMGIIRDVQEIEGKIVVSITPTYSGCPAMNMIAANIKIHLAAAGYFQVDIKEVLSPAWTTDWMTEEGKRKLKEFGIAPPVRGGAENNVLFAEPTPVPCPRCESANTELVSQFGSTACKAMYKCLDCLEPFDYFKCH
ncbi:MAG: phenylacetate-CoA oxygenase subunit PaaJ [Saprospiraceae bacterium]|nr:phenylacetate-CoA oxygenase subunit PaaJ [Saprospiraceae bacterium]